MPLFDRRPGLARHAALLAAACGLGSAHAEHADRDKQIEVSAAQARADRQHQTAEFSGDVVVSQGSLEIHADRVTMRQGEHGERLGIAWGKAGAPVRFRQRGDRPDEWSDGQAERVEYDSVANEVRLIGAATLRNLSGNLVTQSVAGPVITYDTVRDTVTSTAAAGAASTSSSPRVTMVFAPRATP